MSGEGDPLAKQVEALLQSHKQLTQKVTDLERKLTDVNAWTRRCELVKKAGRVARKRRAREAKRAQGTGAAAAGERPRRAAGGKRKMTPKRELREILKVSKGFSVFHRFCEKEGCADNPLFCRIVGRFLDECDSTLDDLAQLEEAGIKASELFSIAPDPAITLAKTIFFDFIVQQSPREVGLAKAVVRKISAGMHKLLRSENRQNLAEMRAALHDAHAEVFGFLASYTLARFKDTQEYEEYRISSPLEDPSGRGDSESTNSGDAKQAAKQDKDTKNEGIFGMIASGLPSFVNF